MTRPELIALLRRCKYGVEASVHADGHPQAAVVGLAVSDELEVVFDTLTTSRKYENLRRDARCAFVVWEDAVTVQLEGRVDEPQGDERERLRTCYFVAFPDGVERSAQPTCTYLRLRPLWVRVSDFSSVPPMIREAAL